MITKRAACGFTLVEMLCVIGIIAGLAGLIFPAMASAKRAALGSVGLSNIRQVGASTFLYAVDNDDRLPYATDDLSRRFSWLHGPDAAAVRAMPLFSVVLLPYTRSREVFQHPLDTGTNRMENGGFEYLRKPTLYVATVSSFQYTVEAGLRLSGSSLIPKLPLLKPVLETGFVDVRKCRRA